MPTTRRRRTRERQTTDGLSEAAYLFFSWGAYFDGEEYEAQTTEAERKAIWRQHRPAIMSRFLAELRQQPGSAGQRPWPFWKWEDREPQRATAPGKFDAQKIWSHHQREYGWYEDDLTYAVRTGVAEPWEVEALEAKGQGHADK